MQLNITITVAEASLVKPKQASRQIFAFYTGDLNLLIHIM